MGKIDIFYKKIANRYRVMNGWEDGWGLLFPPANNMKVRLEGGEFTPDERNYLFTTTVCETRYRKTKYWGKYLGT